jgi:hypothetical protein
MLQESGPLLAPDLLDIVAHPAATARQNLRNPTFLFNSIEI